MTSAYQSIVDQQRSWAHQRGVQFDKDGYTRLLDDNLFLPMHPEVRGLFEAGKGDEIGVGGGRGKMQALHSSSALVFNFFGYWLDRDVNVIASACGAPDGMDKMRFEQKHRMPTRGEQSHVDVEFHGTDLKPLAVESKFTETYQIKRQRAIPIQYVAHKDMWIRLPKCGRLMKRLYDEQFGLTTFPYLDSPQLLKHILGLSTDFGVMGFQLLYLWYDIPSPEAEAHQRELAEFTDQITGEVHFTAMTYQELFKAIMKHDNIDQKYIVYMAERYFQLESELNHAAL